MSILRCTEAFATQVGNVPRVMRPGDLVNDDDPVVKGREDKFEAVEVTVARQRESGPTETATADPGGEKRRLTRPRKKAAPSAKKTATKRAAVAKKAPAAKKTAKD